MDQTFQDNSFTSILESYGIRTIFSDGRSTSGYPSHLELERGSSRQKYTVVTPEVLERGMRPLDQTSEWQLTYGEILVAAGERINARTMAAYRNRGLNYIDLAGNALIKFGDVYIDVQGRSIPRTEAQPGTRTAPVNLFSVRRAQVIFVLIVWPELFDLPIRYVSSAAGVSVGIAFQTIQLLRDYGYVLGEASPQLVRKNELIARWTDAYATGLRNKLVLDRFSGDISNLSRLDLDPSWLVSGESAVPELLMGPSTLTLYAAKIDIRVVMSNRWRRDGPLNIEIKKKFWKDPRQILHEDRGSSYHDNDFRVPALLIYADLMATGDGRQREAAEEFRNGRHELIEG